MIVFIPNKDVHTCGTQLPRQGHALALMREWEAHRRMQGLRISARSFPLGKWPYYADSMETEFSDACRFIAEQIFPWILRSFSRARHVASLCPLQHVTALPVVPPYPPAR